ncbi:MAG: hypothetical protein QOD42_712 [Sphingomonadales bacterium]|jgi:hypothetical protein|nr:hypothetical protein [Sphingomonadales bacterium]
MATATVKFHVLDVGQGACNYVEILNGQGAVTNNLLIDLGTNSSQAIATANLQWLRDKIIANNRYLDVLIITHGDTDHYNMIAKILPAFGQPNHQQIGMTRYGGPAWRYGGGGLITTLAGYTVLRDLQDQASANIGGFTPSQTGYDEATDPVWTPIWAAAQAATEPRLQLIVANTPHPRDPVSMAKKQSMNAEAINTKSVVLTLQWGDYWILATGDATSTTLAEINEILELADQDTFPRTFMLTLPHHGSRKTTYDLKNANDIPDFDARAVVSEFLDIFEPITMSISAGEKRHHHPSMYMILQFSGKLTAADPYWSDPALDGDRHFMTSWVDKAITAVFIDPAWPLRWQYATTKTRLNAYSTLYFNNAQYNSEGYPQYLCPPFPAPSYGPEPQQVNDVPMGRNWEFRWTANARSVISTTNAARAMAEAPDFVPGGGAAAARALPAGAGRASAAPPPRRPIAERLGPRLRGLRTIG